MFKVSVPNFLKSQSCRIDVDRQYSFIPSGSIHSILGTLDPSHTQVACEGSSMEQLCYVRKRLSVMPGCWRISKSDRWSRDKLVDIRKQDDSANGRYTIGQCTFVAVVNGLNGLFYFQSFYLCPIDPTGSSVLDIPFYCRFFRLRWIFALRRHIPSVGKGHSVCSPWMLPFDVCMVCHWGRIAH